MSRRSRKEQKQEDCTCYYIALRIWNTTYGLRQGIWGTRSQQLLLLCLLRAQSRICYYCCRCLKNVSNSVLESSAHTEADGYMVDITGVKVDIAFPYVIEPTD
jgi:hypothetical protein